MGDVVGLLNSFPPDGTAAEQLLPLVYNELRQLAARQLAREAPAWARPLSMTRDSDHLPAR
jgi:hypothetical protein